MLFDPAVLLALLFLGAAFPNDGSSIPAAGHQQVARLVVCFLEIAFSQGVCIALQVHQPRIISVQECTKSATGAEEVSGEIYSRPHMNWTWLTSLACPRRVSSSKEGPLGILPFRSRVCHI